jgi:hypothetical protein
VERLKDFKEERHAASRQKHLARRGGFVYSAKRDAMRPRSAMGS